MANSFNKSYVGLRDDLLKYVKGENVSVLDVGCANGVNGKYLLDNDIADVVYGIEYDKAMSDVAESVYTKTFNGDLNSNKFIEEIVSTDVAFDYIIFGDILEHLVDPLNVLMRIKKMLKQDGKIIISVPNVAHIEFFIQVYLKGTFPQNNRGLFDKTHVRWFTKKDAYKLVQNSGLKVLEYENKYRFRDGSSTYSKYKLLYYFLKLFRKDLVTFQHILICTHE